MTTNRMNIKSMFKAKQSVLEGKLSVLLEHPVAKGNHCESAWIDFFRSFLPNKYAVDKGFVFDAKGNISDQIDIIVYDALYSPLIFGTDAGEKFITAESVYAVFDSKQKINKNTLKYTNAKIKSVTRLVRSSRGIINAGALCPPRDLTRIIGGILAIDSIEPCAIEKNLKNTPSIDIGCSVKKTDFIVARDESGNLDSVQFSPPEESILSFFYIILNTLHQSGTVACIDIRDYADATTDSIKLPREENK